MALIKTKEQLVEKIASCEACLAAKLDGSNGKRSLLVCGGTGCQASQSEKIREELIKYAQIYRGYLRQI